VYCLAIAGRSYQSTTPCVCMGAARLFTAATSATCRRPPLAVPLPRPCKRPIFQWRLRRISPQSYNLKPLSPTPSSSSVKQNTVGNSNFFESKPARSKTRQIHPTGIEDVWAFESQMNRSSHKWIARVTNESLESQMNRSSHKWFARVTNGSLESRMIRSSHKWIMSHFNEAYHIWTSRVTFDCTFVSAPNSH